jgi:hypothetical protein
MIEQLGPDHLSSKFSPVQLDWLIKGPVVCGLPVIHHLKDSLGSIKKSRGSGPGLSIVVEDGISEHHCANHSGTHNAE